MDLTRVSTVPLARLASGSQSRNTYPFWKPQTDASGSSRAWCYLRSRPEGRCGGVGGENPPSRRPQRRAHFPERHRLVPGGASAPSARTAVGTGAGGPHAQAGQAARGGLAGRGPSSLAPCALPRLPALPAGGGAGGSRSGAQTQRRTWLVHRHLAGRAPGTPSPRTGRRVQTRCYPETMDGTRLQSRCRLGPGAPGRPRGARSDAAASPPLCS